MTLNELNDPFKIHNFVKPLLYDTFWKQIKCHNIEALHNQ